MYCVSPELYQQAAALLADAIDDGTYFSGTLVFAFDGMDCRLTASVIVYRQRVSQPEGTTDVLADLVPIWWEFHTVGEDGECLNDFDFAALRHML